MGKKKPITIGKRFLRSEYFKRFINVSKRNEIINQLQLDGRAIQFVVQPDLEMQIIAVQQNYLALQFLSDPTNDVLYAAVKADGYALGLIPVEQRTEALSLVAVQQNGMALQFVPYQTSNICKVALAQTGYAIKYVKNISSEMLLLAVQQNGLVLEYRSTDQCACT
jgi:hypothetical protein